MPQAYQFVVLLDPLASTNMALATTTEAASAVTKMLGQLGALWLAGSLLACMLVDPYETLSAARSGGEGSNRQQKQE